MIANSTSTKQDVVRYLGAPPDNVDVVLLGADESLSPGETSPAPLPAELRRRYGIPEGPYFLLAGKLSKRRNVPLLIEAFAEAQAPELGGIEVSEASGLVPADGGGSDARALEATPPTPQRQHLSLPLPFLLGPNAPWQNQKADVAIGPLVRPKVNAGTGLFPRQPPFRC